MTFAELLAQPGRGGGVDAAGPLRLHGLPRRFAGGGDRRDRVRRGRGGRSLVLRRAPAGRPAVAHPLDPRSNPPSLPRWPPSSTTWIRSSPSTATGATATGPRSCVGGAAPPAGRAPRQRTCAGGSRPTRSSPTSTPSRSSSAASTPAIRSTWPEAAACSSSCRRGCEAPARCSGTGRVRAQPPHPGARGRAGRHGRVLAGLNGPRQGARRSIIQGAPGASRR